MGGRAEYVVPVGCGRQVLVGGLGRVPGVGFASCVRGGRALSAASVFRGVGSLRFVSGGAGSLRYAFPAAAWMGPGAGRWGPVPVEGGVWGGGSLIWAGGRAMFVCGRSLSPSGAGGGFWLVGWGGVSKAVCFRRCRFFGGWFGSFRFRWGGSRVLFRIGPGNRVYGRDIPVEWGLRPGRGSLIWVGRAEDICVRAGVVPVGRWRWVLVGGLARGFRGWSVPPLVAGCVWGRGGCWGRAVCLRRRRSFGGWVRFVPLSAGAVLGGCACGIIRWRRFSFFHLIEAVAGLPVVTAGSPFYQRGSPLLRERTFYPLLGGWGAGGGPTRGYSRASGGLRGRADS